MGKPAASQTTNNNNNAGDEKKNPTNQNQNAQTAIVLGKYQIVTFSDLTGVFAGLLGGVVALLMKSNVGARTSSVIGSRDPSLYRGVHGLKEEYDLIVVGAGLSGAVIAERASSQLGLSSLVIDKRDHIGGNCYDYIDKHGIRVSLYGVHIFHTKYPRVEEYVKKFSKWIPYYHRVVGRVKVRSESGSSSDRVILSIRM